MKKLGDLAKIRKKHDTDYDFLPMLCGRKIKKRTNMMFAVTSLCWMRDSFACSLRITLAISSTSVDHLFAIKKKDYDFLLATRIKVE